MDLNKKREYYREYRKKNKERITNYNRSWYAKNGRERTDGNTLNVLIWQEENPEKVKAHQIVNKAIKNGELIKPKTCESCNQELRLSGHHEDYTKPLEVKWLCSSCHKLVHPRKNNQPKSMGYYAKMKESIENSLT